ncbi:MAG: hypothetical protein OEW58_05725 [Gammaproteobacteria bacterium]|nr:hypothetical protein [Gammaproteobacteria bacterium]
MRKWQALPAAPELMSPADTSSLNDLRRSDWLGHMMDNVDGQNSYAANQHPQSRMLSIALKNGQTN